MLPVQHFNPASECSRPQQLFLPAVPGGAEASPQKRESKLYMNPPQSYTTQRPCAIAEIPE